MTKQKLEEFFTDNGMPITRGVDELKQFISQNYIPKAEVEKIKKQIIQECLNCAPEKWPDNRIINSRTAKWGWDECRKEFISKLNQLKI